MITLRRKNQKSSKEFQKSTSHMEIQLGSQTLMLLPKLSTILLLSNSKFSHLLLLRARLQPVQRVQPQQLPRKFLKHLLLLRELKLTSEQVTELGLKLARSKMLTRCTLMGLLSQVLLLSNTKRDKFYYLIFGQHGVMKNVNNLSLLSGSNIYLSSDKLKLQEDPFERL